MIKKLMALAVGGAAMLMASPALADGSVAKKRAPVVECCDANWNGIYFGGGVGWAAMITDHTDVFGPTATGPTDFHNRQDLGSDGVFGFLRVGLDRQVHPGIVVGAFADFELHDIGAFGSLSNQRRSKKKQYYAPPGNDVFQNDVSLDSAWALGARIGFVRSCCTMWYINGGYTRAEIDHTFTVNNVSLTDSRNDVTLGGFFLGGGVEQQLGRGFALSLEYRYAAYESKEVYNGRYYVNGTEETHRQDIDPTVHSMRLGLTYKFDVHQRAPAPLK
jgi:outer membrane immunogenic protein